MRLGCQTRRGFGPPQHHPDFGWHRPRRPHPRSDPQCHHLACHRLHQALLPAERWGVHRLARRAGDHPLARLGDLHHPVARLEGCPWDHPWDHLAHHPLGDHQAHPCWPSWGCRGEPCHQAFAHQARPCHRVRDHQVGPCRRPFGRPVRDRLVRPYRQAFDPLASDRRGWACRPFACQAGCRRGPCHPWHRRVHCLPACHPFAASVVARQGVWQFVGATTFAAARQGDHPCRLDHRGLGQR